MTINVALLGMKGEFSDYKSRGQGFYRYMYEMGRRLPRNREGIKINKIGASPMPIGKGLSIMLDTLFMDMRGYDIVHNMDLNPFFPVKKGKAKIVTTAHDMQFALEPELSSDVNSLRGRAWTDIVLKLGLKSTLMSDYIIAVSTLTKKDMVKLGFEKEKIFVVNHGVDERFLKKIQKKKPSRDFKIGYIGILRTRKNIPFAIDAFKRLPEGYSFEIWGKKMYDYEHLVELVGSDRRIKFMGFAPDDRFVDILDGFDAFILPSMYEGFGIPIIEAQARGVPVITYKKGKLPDEVKKYCIEAGDSDHASQIIEDLKRNGYNEKRRNAAIKYARSFTWQKTAQETLGVYEKIA